MQDPDTRAGLLALAPTICTAPTWPEPRWLGAQEQTHTVGQWGGAG
jgi:hypothetical protein